jgi:GWxTD domain-containing protein
MKKILTILLLLSSELGFGALNAYFSYATFNQPDGSSYVETYLNVAGSSVVLAKNENGTYQGKIEIQWIFKQGDSIVHFDKYHLLSPETQSADAPGIDFIDQQRVPLADGNYMIELKISDKNSDHAGFNTKQAIRVNYPRDKVSISDIEMLESYEASKVQGKFTKSGFDLIPLVTAFYPKQINSLKFYTEIYRARSILNEEYLLRYSIASRGNNKILNEFASIKKQVPEDVTVLMAEIPIEKLYTGNYYLTVEVFNKRNVLLASKQVFFQRVNASQLSTSDEDLAKMTFENTFVGGISEKGVMIEYISCLYPISPKFEVQTAENIIMQNDLESMQRYFYTFWVKRNPQDPEAAWLEYKAEVAKVNEAFGARHKKGYETDRGRVYLQYGPPNSIVNEEMSPTTRPYSIWHYYQLDHQTNRKFVFYSKGNTGNDYQLLHSDAQGELQDPAWEIKLHDRTQQFGADMDMEKAIDTYGTKTKDNFNHPK